MTNSTVQNLTFDTEAYYFISELHCNNCDHKRDFYMHEEQSFCVCCHEKVVATKQDIKSVANRSPREGINRFSGLIGGSALEKSHNAHFNF